MSTPGPALALAFRRCECPPLSLGWLGRKKDSSPARGDGPWEVPPPNVATASSYPCTWSENQRPPAGSLPALARSDARTKAEASALRHLSRPRQRLAPGCVLCLWPSPPSTPGSSPSSLAALRALPRPHLLLAGNSRNWRAGGGHLSPPTSACNFLLPLWGAPPPHDPGWMPGAASWPCGCVLEQLKPMV